MHDFLRNPELLGVHLDENTKELYYDVRVRYYPNMGGAVGYEQAQAIGHELVETMKDLRQDALENYFPLS